MRYSLIFPGKIKDKHLLTGIEHYQKMLKPNIRLELAPVKDEKIDAPELKDRLLEKEAERLLKAMDSHDFTIVLDEKGKSMNSRQFSKKLESLKLSGKSRVAFVVGSAYGLSPELVKKADLSLSLSSFTLPHQFALLVLAEQIYRATKIARGENYHY
jgi:23S rRNA (pseudouridine1915-N3)-methyltransferase